MFELTTQRAKLASVNARAELHGDDPQPAFDLKLEITCGNDVLIQFHPELRQHLYKKDDNPDLVDQVQGDALTVLRYPKMGAIKWDWEGVGYAATVGYGLGGDSDIQLSDTKIDHFKFEPQNGGSVKVSLRVIAHPAEADVGKLCSLIQKEIDVTLTPPEAKTAGDLFRNKEAA